MGENVKHTPAMSRELMERIVDEVFDGAIEDARVIEEIYAVIKRHEAPSLIALARANEQLAIANGKRALEEYHRADALARQAEALQQEVDSLKQTRQHSREASAALHDAFMEERKRVEALERENAELREALKPFAECAPEWESEPDSLHVFLEWNDEKAPVPSLPVADFRHARALLGVSNAE